MPLTKSLKEEFLAATDERVRFDESMRLHTTFRIGGPAQIWAEPKDVEELRRLLKLAHETELPVTVIGGGANLLVRDDGIPGLVVHLRNPAFQGCHRTPNRLVVGAALPLEWLIRQAKEWRLSGVEFLAGVPGRVGGAVRMNAGTHDEKGKLHALSDVLYAVTVIGLDGKMETLPREVLGFGYRSSRLGEWIVLETTLRLTPEDPGKIAEKINRMWAFKKKTQDWSAPSVGCIFKNPTVQDRPSTMPARGGSASGGNHEPSTLPASAGWLIDQVGLKGFRIGGAQISNTHANFIMNLGSATAADVLALVEETKERVQRRFDVELKLEVQLLPNGADHER